MILRSYDTPVGWAKFDWPVLSSKWALTSADAALARWPVSIH